MEIDWEKLNDYLNRRFWDMIHYRDANEDRDCAEAYCNGATHIIGDIQTMALRGAFGVVDE
jgi:hypothetical protein